MAETTTIVIFGITGDLAQNKLLPALFNLYGNHHLPEDVRIIGFARSPYSNEQCRELTRNALAKAGELSMHSHAWEQFAKRLFYVKGDLTEPKDFDRLRQRIHELEAEQRPANRLFYLSIAPQLYQAAVEGLRDHNLAHEDYGWCRVVIEKPFGSDLASARALNRLLHQVFEERQIYRIDHYLGKETVQNLIAFRFANAIFEPLWNRNYVDNVQITVAEEITVGDRAGYYDKSGIVRDMIQNHLLQLLATVAMEPPSPFDAESLRDVRLQVLRAVRRWSAAEVVTHAVLGQYDDYVNEEGVPPDSKTATYAALRLYVDNWRWHGVPFYLRSGKALKQKTSEIVIQFKLPPLMLFSLGERNIPTPNILSLCLQPDEGVHLKFAIKVPGDEMNTQPVDMEFQYPSAFRGVTIPDAYERLLGDAIEGDSRLFIRNDQIEEAWRIVEPLLPAEANPTQLPLHIYAHGSWGPPAADDLLAADGRSWQRVCGMH